MGQYSKEWWFANGQLAANQRAAVFLEADNVYAQIYADPALTIPLPNPTTTNASGVLNFYAADGAYWIFVGAVDKGASALEAVGPTPENPVLSVNDVIPDGAGNVQLSPSDIQAQAITTINAKGDLYVGTGDNATTRQGVGVDGQVLTADSSQPTGVKWTAGAGGGIPETIFNTKGDIIAASGPDAAARVGVGVDGSVLRADSAAPAGVDWDTLTAADVGADPSGSAAAAQAAAIAASLQKAANLSDVASPSASRTNLGLGDSATRNVGTTAGTVAAGDDSRIVNSVQGPASAVDNSIPRFDGTSGKLIQGSGVTASDTGTLKIPSQGTPPPSGDGNLYYDDEAGTLVFDSDSSPTPLHIGHEVRLEVSNANVYTIPKGSAVYVVGNSGAPDFRPGIDFSLADDGVTSESIGVALDDIGPGDDGFVLVVGHIEGIDTSAFFQGEYVYLSATVPGGLTATPPHQPNYRNVIGITSNVDAVNGSLVVFPSLSRTGHGGSNQYLALDTAGTNQVYRSLLGTAGRLTVTHSSTAATFDVDSALLATINGKVDKSTLSAKGSLIAASSPATPVDVPVGANDLVLTADSTQTAGVAWKPVPSAPVTSVNGETGAVVLDATDVGADPAGAAAAVQAASLQKAANLSDVASPSTSRTNLGLGTAAVTDTGTGPTNTILGNDARLTDARTPTAHAATHASLGSDPVTLAQSQITNLITDLAGKQPLDADLTTIAGLTPTNNDFLQYKSGAWANRTVPQVKTDLAYTPSDIGAVPTTRTITAGTGLTGGGDLSADRTLSANFGTSAGSITEGNDARVTGAQQRSTLTAKADLYVATASGVTTRQPVGTNSQVLRANSATATGLEYATLTAADVSAVPTTRNVNTINGLQGGGALSADLTLQPTFGTSANTVAQGNDTRIVNSVQGPASAASDAITVYNGTSGKQVRNSNVFIDSNGVIILPNQASVPNVAGRFGTTGSTLAFTYNDPGLTQVNIGQQLFLPVNNNSGVNISAGAPVYITGLSGGRALVSAARADALASAKVAGVAQVRIDAGNDGYVLVRGQGTANTTGMSVGDIVYLAATGDVTNTAPASPNFVTRVGTVMVVGAAGTGIINTGIQGPTSGGTNGQIEVANSSSAFGVQWSNNLSGGLNPFGAVTQQVGGFITSRSSTAAVLNQMYLIPMWLLRPGTMSTLQIEVTGATAGSVTRAGIYGSNSSNLPTGSPISDFGTVATATTGVKSWGPLGLSLSANTLYWVAVAPQVAAPNLRFISDGSNPFVPRSGGFPTGANPWHVAFTQVGVSGALPAIGAISTDIGPMLGVQF